MRSSGLEHDLDDEAIAELHKELDEQEVEAIEPFEHRSHPPISLPLARLPDPDTSSKHDKRT